MNLGSWEIDQLLTFSVNTHGTTGAETDADSVPTYRVYEDETTAPILTGSMAKLDDANTLGFYSEQITLSAANGFEWGKSYNIRITATVGGITGTTLRYLQIGASINVTRLKGGTANVDKVEALFDNYDSGVNDLALNISGNLSGSVGSVTNANAIADALLDRTDGVETGLTLRGAMRLQSAALAGKLSGAGTTTITIRNTADSKARITATVDSSGNRSALTLDAT